ncbi:histidine phosphatase family protein [Candidatus Bathyarchaeota archaeon]|nr:histidine phosphatase family protein [Candidatus Bathyarchaeota archaeon]
MPLILIRHGEAEHQIKDITGGWTDSNLTPLGVQQAQKVGESIKNLLKDEPCRIVTSDLKRAYQTAQIIGEILNVKPESYHRLREYNNGDAAWKTIAEAAKMYTPPTFPTIDWCPYPGAETWRTFYIRISEAMDKIFITPEETLIIVGHSGNLIQVTHWWLGLPIDLIDDISYKFDNASITILSETELNEKIIEKLNDVTHLQ